jgi:regulator of sigma E protease
MEILQQFIGAGGSALTTLLAFLFVLVIIVFFHELGHFLVARWNGVTVEAFSVGFGKELVGFTDKHGTRWKLAPIPLGGYVKFKGDENAASVPDHEKLASMSAQEREGTLESKTVGQRAAVVAAGPIANFILALVIFTGSFFLFGTYESDPIVSEVQENSAAYDAGIQVGDKFVAIDGVETPSFMDVRRIVSVSPDRELSFTIERNNSLIDLKITPRMHRQEDRFGNFNKVGLLGVVAKFDPEQVRHITYSPISAVTKAANEVWFVIKQTFQFIYDLIAGRQDVCQVGGPVKIVKTSGQVATLGIGALVNFAAFLSIGIGLINLFPIPMLDGGHLVFYAIEAIRGKPLGAKAQDICFRIGLGLIMALMVFVIFNDLTNSC